MLERRSLGVLMLRRIDQRKLVQAWWLRTLMWFCGDGDVEDVT